MSAPTWTGYCTGCTREGLEVASRREHFERVLCATCAARPAKPFLATPDRPEDHDPGLHQMADGSTVERDQDGQIIGVYVEGDVWAQWEADRRQRVAKCRATRPARLADLQATLAAAGLCPVVDQELGLVQARCPACGAGDGLWRPYAVIPRADKVMACCSSCGIEEVDRV